MGRSTDTETAMSRLKDAEKAIAKAEKALGKARKGLSAVETVAEKAEAVKRHPVRTGAIAVLVASIATLVVIGLRNSSD